MNDKHDAEDPRLIVDSRSDIRLRDLFAAAALAGLIVAETDETVTWAELADDAYDIADAMLDARTRA